MSLSDEDASRRTGMPEPSFVVSEKSLKPAQRGTDDVTHNIIRTSETDPYDVPLQSTEFATLGLGRFAGYGDAYQGTARQAAKLSIAPANVEVFADLEDLVTTLPPDSYMISHQPPITIDANSGRVAEENRNVRVRGFLYAASREADNDYLLIVGQDPNLEPVYMMTMAISGLPPQGSEYFSRLKAARDAYKEFFGAHLPGASYDFYDPPIPVEVEGSLFFNISHSHSSRPGPPSLRLHMPTIWEIHPITNIIFNPHPPGVLDTDAAVGGLD
jgi:hypothetical protein